MSARPAYIKLIEPAKPEADKLLVFWLFIFALPALIIKLALGFYIDSASQKAFLLDSQKLRHEAESFSHDLKIENMLTAAVTSCKNRLEKIDWPDSDQIELASLSERLSRLFTENHSLTPVFCGISNLQSGQTGSFSQPGTPVNPGRRSFEIIMSRLYPRGAFKGDEEKRYQLISKNVFGSFLEPSIRPGVLRSGFFGRGKSDRLFVLHDRFTNYTDNKSFACLLIFSENSIGLKNLLKFARTNPSAPEFMRGYGRLPVIPDRKFAGTTDDRLFFASAIDPSVLRVGSHAGNSWYDASIRSGDALKKPSMIPFMIVTKKTTDKTSRASNYLPFINLALLAFVFAGLAITRQYLAGNLYPAPLQQRFKLSILAATLMPFAALFITAREFTEHFSRVMISSQTQNIVNDLQMLELNILNNDLRERQTTSKFVADLNLQRMQPASDLKKTLDDRLGTLYEGYALLRSDGLYIEHLPDRASVSADDFNKLQMVKEVNFSQYYNIFLEAGALTADFASNAARIKDFVKWKAFSLHFNEVDRDSFSTQDGEYYLSRNAEKNYYRISFHNLFPAGDKTELWAGLTLIKNSRGSVENFLRQQNHGELVYKQRNDLTTHSAVFRRHEDGSGIDLSFAWPANSLKDKELLAAARRINENKRETSWLDFDENGMVTIFAAKAMSELPFLLVSRCLISTTALNDKFFQLAGILFIPYAMLLIAVLSMLLADVFLKPLNMLIEGVQTLDKGIYPTLDYSADNELGTLVTHFNGMSEGMRQRQLLQRFVSDEVSQSISEETELMKESAGSLVYRVIMFIHIKDFARLCEQIEPEQAITILNLYFSTFEPCLKKFNGQIDKYIGDAIMLSFSREKCSETPEVDACRAALACLAELKGLNQKLANEHLPAISIGAGIAGGKVIRGKIGARQSRKDFTLIGDPVNLAARLESSSHFDNGPHILIASNIATSIQGILPCFFHASLAIKGKAESVAVYELQGAVDAD